MNENEIEGEVWTTRTLDREATSEFVYTAMAIDKGGKVGFTSLCIIVDDLNDNKPEFSQLKYMALLRENSTSGTSVIKVSFILYGI